MPRIKKQWISANKNNVYIGAKVRVREGITPRFGWGYVKEDEIGKVLEINSVLGRDLRVDFPRQPCWYAVFEDLEVINAKD